MKRKKPETVVGFVALGCAKNTVDSERMLAQIATHPAFSLTMGSNCDVLVVNTCGFIAPAQAEAMEAIKEALERKSKGAVKKVVVAGCLSQRLGRRLFEKAPGIDAVMGLAARDNIVEIIEQTLASDGPIAVLDAAQPSVADDRSRLLTGPGHWAYLRISEGCERRCSFCTIPDIRGPLRSKPPELVLAEAAELASAGVVEVSLIAQDTTTYGKDLGCEGLPALLGKLEKVPGIRWIRLLYANPAGITEQLIDVIAGSEKIARYIDMPVQHISDRILKSMHRPETDRSIRNLVERLRLRIPGCVLRTTVIVGYPGETDQEFEQLLQFVRWAGFEHLGCFTFWPEDETAAAALPDQVPGDIKQSRFDTLMPIQRKMAMAANRRRVGKQLSCLVDQDNTGRFYGQAPEVDSVCLIRNCSTRAGRFVNVKVVGTSGYDLVVEQI